MLALDNAYEEYVAEPPPERQGVIQRYVNLIVSAGGELPGDFEDAKPFIYPQVRARSYLASLELQSRLDGDRSPITAFATIADHFAVKLGWDQPNFIEEIRQDRLNDWNVSFYEALSFARKNLSNVSTDSFRQPQAGVFQSTWHDAYDTARLLLHNLIRQLEVKGDHVAMIPNRDTLLVTGSEDPSGLAAIAEIAETALAEPRAISGVLIRLQRDQWKEFMVPEEHPAFLQLNKLRVDTIAREYEHQEQLLNRYYKANDKDVFVAPIVFYQNGSGGRFKTAAPCPAGWVSEIPRADIIAVLSNKENVIGVTWEKFVEIAGDSLQKQEDLYPERFRIERFPTKGQLESLRVAAIEP